MTGLSLGYRISTATQDRLWRSGDSNGQFMWLGLNMEYIGISQIYSHYWVLFKVIFYFPQRKSTMTGESIVNIFYFGGGPLSKSKIRIPLNTTD